jgi:hypothetical protein
MIQIFVTCCDNNSDCNEIYKYNVEKELDKPPEMDSKTQREPGLKTKITTKLAWIFLSLKGSVSVISSDPLYANMAMPNSQRYT